MQKSLPKWIVRGSPRASRLALLPTVEAAGPGLADPFAPERRFEQRFPASAARLASFLPGYERSPEAALALLGWLEAHCAVNEALAGRIRELAG
jgi:lincosamide nucleotidyltransferase B/F